MRSHFQTLFAVFVALACALTGLAQAQLAPVPGAITPAWDAFVELPTQLQLDGTAVMCPDLSADVVNGRCVKQLQVLPGKAVPVQEYLERYLKDKLPANKLPKLVAVGPAYTKLSRDTHHALSNRSFFAYYKVVDAPAR